MTLPAQVAHTREALLHAAAEADWLAFDSLALQRPGTDSAAFLYTLGPLYASPVAFWQTYYENGAFFEELSAVLSSCPTYSNGSFGWPSWAWAAFDSLSATDQALLNQIAPERNRLFASSGEYFGPTTAIDSTGRWLYYVAGE